MEFEQNVELRRVYMLSLSQFLTNIGCAKWCERLTRILSEYCEHHTDLKTLKATLEVNIFIRHFYYFYWLLCKLHIISIFRLPKPSF